MSTEGAHAAAAAAQLLDVLGEAAVHWPGGDQAAAVNVTAIIDRTAQMSAFTQLETPGKRSVPLQAIITLPVSVVVTVNNEPRQNSVFVFDGKGWHAERILSVDQGMQEVQVKFVHGVHVSRGSR